MCCRAQKKKGSQGLGRSKGGLTTKIHAVSVNETTVVNFPLSWKLKLIVLSEKNSWNHGTIQKQKLFLWIKHMGHKKIKIFAMKKTGSCSSRKMQNYYTSIPILYISETKLKII